ncbi:MAG: hypothetical protein ABIQ95_04605 [Bdellovibrionia bacterium]
MNCRNCLLVCCLLALSSNAFAKGSKRNRDFNLLTQFRELPKFSKTFQKGVEPVSGDFVWTNPASPESDSGIVELENRMRTEIAEHERAYQKSVEPYAKEKAEIQAQMDLLSTRLRSTTHEINTIAGNRDKKVNQTRYEFEERINQMKSQVFRALSLQLMGDQSEVASTPLSNAIQDAVSLEYLNAQISKIKRGAVFLAIGNSETELSDELKTLMGTLIEKLLERQVLILFDQDSKAAEWIEKQVPLERRLGISGNWALWREHQSHPEKKMIVIENSFNRMSLILSISKIIFSPDSILGAGLLISGEKSSSEFAVLDPLKKWKSYLSSWSYGLRSGLGVRYSGREPEVLDFEGYCGLSFISDFHLLSNYRSIDGGLPPFEPLKIIQALSSEKILDLAETAARFSELSMTLHKGLHLTEGFTTGAVVFGSSREEPQFRNLVIDAVKALAEANNPIVTGGAGGFMRTANKEAFRSHVPSIGIPMGGGARLMTELKSFDEFHSLTLNVSGYSERIPLLLQDRQWVIIAPGGMGTMKELGVTLTQFAAEGTNGARIVFLSSHYYGPIFKALSQNIFPESFRSRVKLADDLEGMRKILDGKDTPMQEDSDSQDEQPTSEAQALKVTPAENRFYPETDLSKPKWWKRKLNFKSKNLNLEKKDSKKQSLKNKNQGPSL